MAVLGSTAIPLANEMKKAYIASADHVAASGNAAHADIELNGYPFVDNGVTRMDSCDARRLASPTRSLSGQLVSSAT